MSDNIQFNPPDDLEEELARFRAAPIPSRLRDQIAGRIAATSRPGRRLLPAVITFSAIAASVVIVAAIWRFGIHHEFPSTPGRIDDKFVRRSWPSLPTVGAFNQVIAQSPQAIDPCLDFQNQLQSRKKTVAEFRASDQSID